MMVSSNGEHSQTNGHANAVIGPVAIFWDIENCPVESPCLVLVIEWQLRWTNKCLCWDTQEISPHKDTSMSNMCHGGEMAKGWCYAHIVWSRNSLHMRHDMELCDQSGEDQDKAWLDGPVAMEKGKSRLWSEGPRGGEAWARFGADGPRQRWRASKVKIDGPKRSCDDMKWIISFKKDQAKCWLMMMIKRLDGVWCLCGINIWEDEMECARQKYDL